MGKKSEYKSLKRFYINELKKEPQNQIDFIREDPEDAYRIFSIFGDKKGLGRIVEECKESNPWLAYHTANELGKPIKEPYGRNEDEVDLPINVSRYLGRSVQSLRVKHFNPDIHDLAYADDTFDSVAVVPKLKRGYMESARFY